MELAKVVVLGDLVTVCDALQGKVKLIGVAIRWLSDFTLKACVSITSRGVKGNSTIRDINVVLDEILN